MVVSGNITSTKGGFRTTRQAVAPNQHTRKGLSSSYLENKFQQKGIKTQQLNIQIESVPKMVSINVSYKK